MAQWLRQSTAVTVKFGPFLDENDGKTVETGLTINQADIRLSKNGGAFAQTNNAAGATHDENGWYGIPLDTTDTGTLARLIVSVHKSGALPVWREFIILPANVYDSFCASDKLQVDATQIEGVDATTQIGDAVWDKATSGHTSSGTFGEQAKVDIDSILTRVTNPGRITVSSPVASDGTITITQGDDYAVADGTQITITKTNYTGPLASEDTVAFRLMTLTNYNAGGEIAALTVAAEVTVETDAVFTIQLTAAQTAALGPAPPADKLNYVYQLIGTSANNKVVTEAIGAFTVVAQVPAA